MAKAIGITIVVAALVGGLVGLVNAYIDGPSWLGGAVAGAVGAVTCGSAYKAQRGK